MIVYNLKTTTTKKQTHTHKFLAILNYYLHIHKFFSVSHHHVAIWNLISLGISFAYIPSFLEYILGFLLFVFSSLAIFSFVILTTGYLNSHISMAPQVYHTQN